MRFDTPIHFQKLIPGGYNKDTGNYEDDKIEETLGYADVTNAGTQTMTMVYGSIKQGALTVRIQNWYKDPFSYIRIGNKKYRSDFMRILRGKQTFVVSEVQA